MQNLCHHVCAKRATSLPVGARVLVGAAVDRRQPPLLHILPSVPKLVRSSASPRAAAVVARHDPGRERHVIDHVLCARLPDASLAACFSLV